MAHNQVTDLATSLEGCPQLAELRLSHNKLSGLPESLAHCPRLKIVDLGGNLVESLTDIKVCLPGAR
jgi:Leucine-rich repeat (LRR) protein